MIAFHGDPAIKERYLARVRAHILADEVIHGVYWENGRGCAIGCSVHSSNHAAYETELGIPRILARLEDGIFEAMSNGRAKQWPEQFLSSIRVGADLSLVWPKFAVWLLVDDKYGVLQFAKSEKSKKAIRDIADAYQGVADGKEEAVDWRKLRVADADAAYASAATDAAYADADADAAAAYAEAAAYAAAAADADADADADAAYASAAADAAAYAAAAYAKREEWREAQADKLLELMASA